MSIASLVYFSFIENSDNIVMNANSGSEQIQISLN
jgi:hypothetical protein